MDEPIFLRVAEYGSWIAEILRLAIFFLLGWFLGLLAARKDNR
jgi:hypothetical protein